MPGNSAPLAHLGKFAEVAVRRARKLYGNDSFGVYPINTVYARDATTIHLCLSLSPWAPLRTPAGLAVRLHILLDLRGNIPVLIHIMDGKTHEVSLLDLLSSGARAFYVIEIGVIWIQDYLEQLKRDYAKSRKFIF